MQEKVVVGDETFVPLIREDALAKRTKEIANVLQKNLGDKNPVFIGILNGAFMFMSDLVKEFTAPCEVDFLKIKSYGDNKVSSGKVKLKKDIDAVVNQRHVVIVEDIIDTGLSLSFLIQLLKKQEPASITVVSLLFKPHSLKYDLKIDYIGFEIPSRFVIGYGLDYAQQYRNLRAVYVLDEDNN